MIRSAGNWNIEETMTERHREDLRRSFKNLDHQAALNAWRQLPPDATLQDADRIAAAFGLLATGFAPEAERVLDGVSGDGTAPLADLAYVRAFRAELDSDQAAMVEILSHHLDAPDATHGGRMRLRMAEACLRLNRHREVLETLKPLLEPPGCAFTLEAQLILLEGMLVADAGKEKLIEQVALLDLLIERGFRLAEAPNVVYYARLLHDKRIEPGASALLRAHDELLDAHDPGEEGEIAFLLSAGDKYKAPAAVRAAGRGYTARPFAWKEMDPERVAYLFASHEEHDAARLSIIHSHTRSAIRKNADLWGVLLLESYHAGKWQDALDMMREFRNELKTHPRATEIATWRPVCEYHLGRYEEALEHILKLGDPFASGTTGREAACAPLALASLGRHDELEPVTMLLLTRRQEDKEFQNELLSCVLNELMILDLREALQHWVRFLCRLVSGENREWTLLRIGEAMIHWSHEESARLLCEGLSPDAGKVQRLLLEGLIATARLDAETAIDRFKQILESPAPMLVNDARIYKARACRRLGLREEALRAVEEVILSADDYPRIHAALALKAGLMRDGAADESLVRETLAEAGRAAHRHAQSREQYAMLVFEIRQLLAGDSPRAQLEALEAMEGRRFDTVETLRLARRILNSPDATAAEKESAARIEARWAERNLAGRKRATPK